MKLLKKIGILFLILYVIACICMFFAQEKIFFRPYKTEASHVFRMGDEVDIKVEDDIFLNCLHIKENNPKGLILYLHGNRGMIRRSIGQTRTMRELGYDVFLPDYRGYGKSGGVLKSEKQMLEDMDIVMQHLLKTYQAKDMIVIGFSMGSGMASYLATKYPVKSLLLVAPFCSLVDLKNKYLPIIPNFIMKYKFRNDRFLEKVNCNVHIVHGTKDELIPVKGSVKLKDMHPKKVSLYLEDGHSHRSIIFSDQIRTILKTKVL